MQLTGDDSYTAIPCGYTSIGNVFHPIGEEPGQANHKYALRDGIMEKSNTKDDRDTIFQGHRGGIGGSLKTLWFSHSEWLSSLPKPVPFIGHKHRREYGVICQVQKGNDKLPDIGKHNAQVKSFGGRL